MRWLLEIWNEMFLEVYPEDNNYMGTCGIFCPLIDHISFVSETYESSSDETLYRTQRLWTPSNF